MATTLYNSFDMCADEIAELIEHENIGLAIPADTDVCGVTLVSSPYDEYEPQSNVSGKVVPCGIGEDGPCVIVLATTEVFDPNKEFLGHSWRFEERIEGRFWVYETRDCNHGMSRPIELDGTYDVYSNHGIVIFWLYSTTLAI